MESTGQINDLGAEIGPILLESGSSFFFGLSLTSLFQLRSPGGPLSRLQNTSSYPNLSLFQLTATMSVAIV